MKIQEKVKDLVEVRHYKGLRDFHADPTATLESYCFTDETASLMAAWLDSASSIGPGRGRSLALAGYRGVGKSHFLATFGSILALPELRSKIPNPHVSVATQGLLRRHYPLLNVRRGSQETLIEELKTAISASIGPEAVLGAEAITTLLERAAARSGDVPLVIIVDTAHDRINRVARNDGDDLAEMSSFASENNAVLAVALDDDIAGADGSNSAIVRAFNIDFLDQQHLFKVVNSFIFPKNNQKLALIEEIYAYFSRVVPNFRWSSQRFVSLYPLHPGILDVAPYVRLFVQDFALLGFAAEAGERILGRPATSLIAFDEVFDNAEAGLRKIQDLEDAFSAYDRLNSEVVSKVPVMQRLQAKLILKALLLLSLNGRGATVEEICASMMIYDEADPTRALESVNGIIRLFAEALPDDISSYSEEGVGILYSFRANAKESANSVLDAAIGRTDPVVAVDVLRKLLQERYPDLTLTAATDIPGLLSSESIAVWRGGQRRGRFYVALDENGRESIINQEESLDWRATLDLSGVLRPRSLRNVAQDCVLWQPDQLRKDEIDTLLRYHVLQTEADLIETFGDQHRALLHSQRVAAVNIAERVFLTNGNLVINGFDFNFTEEAIASQSVSGLISAMLDPMFETQYPEHPVFDRTLGVREVASAITDFFDPAKTGLDETQELAAAFLIPLGLAAEQGGTIVPINGERLDGLPFIRSVTDFLDASSDGQVEISKIYQCLKQQPFGFVREAQHLILASLVADRRIEFVTTRGDRINSRSLDLKIVWGDIVGIARPAISERAVVSNIKWAQILTGVDADLTGSRGSEEVVAALSAWLEEWNAANLLNRFDKVPDALVNTKIWLDASFVKKTLGRVVEALNHLTAGTFGLDQALGDIAEAFSHSEGEFEKSVASLERIEMFLSSVAVRQRIVGYTTPSGFANESRANDTKRALLACLSESVRNPASARNRETGYLWDGFRTQYRDSFSKEHMNIMRSHELQEKFDSIRRTDIWWEFESLSEIPQLRTQNWHKAVELSDRMAELDCGFESEKGLEHRAGCICGFDISGVAEWEAITDRIWKHVTAGHNSIRETIVRDFEWLLARTPDVSGVFESSGDYEAFKSLVNGLRSGELRRLSKAEIDLLHVMYHKLGGLTGRHSGNEQEPSSHLHNASSFVETEVGELAAV